MRKHFWIFIIIATMLLTSSNIGAQDGLDLPTELYILLNDGTVERYGLGASGATTITPANVYVIDFAVAPDGAWMAYRTEGGMMLQHTLWDSPIQLEGTSADVPPIRGRGDTIAWSPQGKTLSYTTSVGIRSVFNIGTSAQTFADMPTTPIQNLVWSPGGTYLAAEGEEDVWWIYQNDGTQLYLAAALPLSYSTAWLNDYQIISAPGAGGLVMIDIANGNIQTTLQDASRLYKMPGINGDGTISVFSRKMDIAESEIDPNSFTWQKISFVDGVVSITEGNNVPIDISNQRWAPKGDFLISLNENILSLTLPASAMSLPLPIENIVAYTWGAPHPQEATGLPLNYDGFFLAPDIFGIGQVWKLPANGETPTPLTAGESDVTAYTINQRGTEVAFVRDSLLWIADINNNGEIGETLELATVDSNTQDLEFSPDGNTIVFADPGGIWTMGASDATPTLILESSPPSEPGNHFYTPHYAPNINAFLVVSYLSEASQYYIFDPASGGLVDIGAHHDARWMVDGRLLSHGDGVWMGDWPQTAKLNILDLSTSPPGTLSIMQADGMRIHDVRVTAEAQLGIIMSDNGNMGPLSMSLFSLPITGGEPQHLADLGFIDQPQLSPDGAFVAGIAYPDSKLVIYSVAEGQQTIINMPSGVSDFQWQREW